MPSYLILAVIFAASFYLLNKGSFDQINVAHYDFLDNAITETRIKPDYVRAIYLTAYSASNEDFRQSIIAKIKDSRINTVIIDIKDYSGYILYNSELQNLHAINAVKYRMKDVQKILDDFHQAEIYVIARQTVFQDPVLAEAMPNLAFQTWQGNIWRDNKGLAWVDPNKKEVWQYNLAIAKEATDFGFDEINFDYMRYPSDGNMANINYALPENKVKTDVMKEFYKFLSDNLSDHTTISIDMFGLVMDHTDDGYDLNIGQKLLDAVDYFDYVYPMMYASHYPLNYLGLENSAEYPGIVIAHGLKISQSALENKRAKIRPWLQAFNIGATYDAAKINAQITATENATSTTAGWALWNARNYYPDYIFTK